MIRYEVEVDAKHSSFFEEVLKRFNFNKFEIIGEVGGAETNKISDEDLENSEKELDYIWEIRSALSKIEEKRNNIKK